MAELPTITGSAHTHAVYNGVGMQDHQYAAANGVGQVGQFGISQWVPDFNHPNNLAQIAQEGLKRGYADAAIRANQGIQPIPIPSVYKAIPMTQRRFVQVFIADTNENVPLDQCVLYQGGQHLTDATDQELFYEVDIKTLLDKHNAERVKLIDKRVKERTEYLEPAKIRDLKMVVVTIATL